MQPTKSHSHHTHHAVSPPIICSSSSESFHQLQRSQQQPITGKCQGTFSQLTVILFFRVPSGSHTLYPMPFHRWTFKRCSTSSRRWAPSRTASSRSGRACCESRSRAVSGTRPTAAAAASVAEVVGEAVVVVATHGPPPSPAGTSGQLSLRRRMSLQSSLRLRFHSTWRGVVQICHLPRWHCCLVCRQVCRPHLLVQLTRTAQVDTPCTRVICVWFTTASV